MQIRRPNTLSDTTRIEMQPEFIISKIGCDKKHNLLGSIIVNLPLREELSLYDYISISIAIVDDKVCLLLSSKAAFDAGVYRLTDENTTVTNRCLFREMIDLCDIDFSEGDTYHFYNIEYCTDEFGTPFAIVDLADCYVSEGAYIPYQDRLDDTWEDLYEEE